jgi:hypothetical protein
MTTQTPGTWDTRKVRDPIRMLSILVDRWCLRNESQMYKRPGQSSFAEMCTSLDPKTSI